MTEAEWLTCTDPTPMLEFLRGKASDRKLRLFACACCRRILHLFTDKNISRKTIEFAERFADGEATKNDLHGGAWGKPGQAHPVVQREAWDAAIGCADYGADKIANAVLGLDEEKYKAWQSAWDSAWNQWNLAQNRWYYGAEAKEIADASMPAKWVASGKSARSEERKCQSFVFRDISGNPFRPISINLAWLTPAVVELDQSIYDDRAFDWMPALADALHDAGCDNDEILSHCRGPGPHVRGCWVVDIILGRA